MILTSAPPAFVADVRDDLGMELSSKAKNELREILGKEIDAEVVDGFSDEDINNIGLLLLNTLAESLKMDVAGPELRARTCE